jgi:hypothetical protein
LLEPRSNVRERFPRENCRLRYAKCAGASRLANVIDAMLHRLSFTGAHIWRGKTGNLENRVSSLQHADCLPWLSTRSSRMHCTSVALAAPRHLRDPAEFMTWD